MTIRGCGKIRWMLVALITLFMVSCYSGKWIAGEKDLRITKEELKEMLGKTDVIILDVRSASDWKKGEGKILGAIREEPDRATKSWAEKYPKDKTIVLYCAWPNEGTSARVAQDMISMGFTKVFALKGGWKDWSKANYPMEAK